MEKSNPHTAEVAPRAEAATKTSEQGGQSLPSGAERRRQVRYLVSATALVIESTSRTRLTGRASDLGLAGCYVDLMSPFPVGSSVLFAARDEGHTASSARRAWPTPCRAWEWGWPLPRQRRNRSRYCANGSVHCVVARALPPRRHQHPHPSTDSIENNPQRRRKPTHRWTPCTNSSRSYCAKACWTNRKPQVFAENSLKPGRALLAPWQLARNATLPAIPCGASCSRRWCRRWPYSFRLVARAAGGPERMAKGRH